MNMKGQHIIGPLQASGYTPWLTTVREAGQEVKKQRGSKINLLPLQALISITHTHTQARMQT